MTARGARPRSAQAMDDMAPPGSSSSSRVELAALIARCVALAEGAGALIREVYHQSGAVAVTYKGGGSSDPVTTADWRAQRHIAGSLALAYPGLLVIGEEDEEAVAAQDDVPLDPGAGLGAVLPEHQLPAELQSLELSGLVIWLDPLDGTRSFVERRPADVTTMIGIAYRGAPLAGVVSFPLDDARPLPVWGGPALGLHGVAVAAGAAAAAPDDRPVVGLSWWVAEDAGKLAAVEAALPQEKFRIDTTAGGSGHLVVKVLEGKLDAARKKNAFFRAFLC